jgi:PAS domain S-box-containing protein
MTFALSLIVVISFVALCAAARTLQSFARERARATELQRRLDLFSRLSPVGVFHTDAHGRCTYADDLSFGLAGLRAQSARGHTWVDAIHPDDREHVVSKWMSAAAAGEPYRDELRVVRPDTSTAWVAAELRERRDPTGKSRGFIGAITDVTGRKQVEGELESLRDDLERRVAERTAILSETNRRLIHEVRVRDRMERALTHVPSEVADSPKIASRSRRVDQ